MRNKLVYGLIVGLISGIVISSCKSGSQIDQARYYVNGKTAYEKHCQNCHGAQGEGLGLLIPPLTDTSYISANKNSLAAIIKYGMEGPVTINGQLYNEQMPAETHLTPIEITYIINYIGNSFGNEIGLYTPEQVQQDLIEHRPK